MNRMDTYIIITLLLISWAGIAQQCHYTHLETDKCLTAGGVSYINGICNMSEKKK